MEFDLSAFNTENDRRMLQHAIDGVNKAALIYPSAWENVKNGELVKANSSYENSDEVFPIATIVFKEMDQDGHSGTSAWWVIKNITWLSNGKPESWKTDGFPKFV